MLAGQIKNAGYEMLKRCPTSGGKALNDIFAAYNVKSLSALIYTDPLNDTLREILAKIEAIK